MRSLAKATLATVAIAGALALPASAQAATPAPAWAVQSLASPTNFKPSDETGLDRYLVYLTNSGAKAMNGKEIVEGKKQPIAVEKEQPITITDTLPAGLAVAG